MHPTSFSPQALHGEILPHSLLVPSEPAPPGVSQVEANMRKQFKAWHRPLRLTELQPRVLPTSEAGRALTPLTWQWHWWLWKDSKLLRSDRLWTSTLALLKLWSPPPGSDSAATVSSASGEEEGLLWVQRELLHNARVQFASVHLRTGVAGVSLYQLGFLDMHKHATDKLGQERLIYFLTSGVDTF